jgi:hypothetical protein
MKARGWRRIGIILSVIWFLGFGVLLWHQFVEDAVAPYTLALKTCSAIEESSNEFWRQNARDADELGEKLSDNLRKWEKCLSDAKLQWESTERPSNGMQLAAVLGVDLITIALGWLIVWGCVAVVRWVHRGFVTP